MSRMQRLDGCQGDERNPPSPGVCERPPIQYARNPDKWWPFLFSLRDNRWYVNKAKQRSKAEQAQDVGDALF